MKIGDILYHKLTGQEVIVIEDIDENYELDDFETLECRYVDKKGIYQSEDFYACELLTKKPRTKPTSVSCKCAGGGGGAYRGGGGGCS